MDANNAIARLYALPRSRFFVETKEGTITLSRVEEMPRQNLPMAAQFEWHAGLTTLTPQDYTDTPKESQCDQYIPISFDKLPKTTHGLIFGCDKASDVRLPDTGCISRFHFSIGFDDQRRLMVKDLNSLNGTQVTFGDKGEGVRRKFQWLVGGINDLSREQIVIRVSDELSLWLVHENHGIREAEHRDKVDRFRRGTQNSGSLQLRIHCRVQSQLGLRRGKKPPSTAQDDAIHLLKKLGNGSSGTATYRWNVSTGEEVVLKQPLGDFREDTWMQEAEIMNQLRHENILRLIDSDFSSIPTLYLEYCPGGTLSDIENQLSAGEILEVLQQSLAGLSFAHGLGVAHRDLKPENILVLSRNPLQIKIADFGLAKNIARLQTWCGTPDFMAPEIWTGKGYTGAVDIWALGALVYELLFGYLFMSRDPTAPANCDDYCHAIVRRLNCYLAIHSGTMAEFVAKYMLQVIPENRLSAARCHVLAMALPPPSDRIQRPQSSHFATTYSTTDYSSGNDTWSTFNGAATDDESRTITALSSQTFASGYTDTRSPLFRTSTGHGNLTVTSLGSPTVDSGYTAAAAHEDMHSWSDDCPVDWHQGNTPRQTRDWSADDSENVSFCSQSPKVCQSSEEPFEGWKLPVNWSEGDTVMTDNPPED
ncbi:protein kinase [Akanthomyces lecanii RCEF 1005]|uniref:non-specific serine/threonine protein kinase n=1 Tax=Akanthomyces lecanii RCEF 1005 TaxID=1081108 RepID=A0A162KCV3_CORDF|nr:protein kinase [Akanthomyces lecanii RCEF 1005]